MLKDAMVRAGRSAGRAALLYQHSDFERRREVAAGLDQLVRGRREAADNQASGAVWHGTLELGQTTKKPPAATGGFVMERVTRIELAL
ncbi:hypothetical protein ACIQVO_33150 [Streptomyces sp. NPDC101062]|uniref:hypothetical protein n=1 Tax=unclassified Streptomyces TaxID=2593676 RepID=UPI0038028A29